jgi:hypothetical protein
MNVVHDYIRTNEVTVTDMALANAIENLSAIYPDRHEIQQYLNVTLAYVQGQCDDDELRYAAYQIVKNVAYRAVCEDVQQEARKYGYEG